MRLSCKSGNLLKMIREYASEESREPKSIRRR